MKWEGVGFEFKILFCYWLEKYSCVDRSTRQIWKSTHEKANFGVSRSKSGVSIGPTQQKLSVSQTRRVPLRTAFFDVSPFFGETIFPVDTACSR